MRTVLVPLDGSRLAERVLGAVRRLVRPDGPRVVGSGRTLAGRRRAGRYLARVRERLERRGLPARVVVRAGDPATEILRVAPAEQAGLIAMSAHGRTGLRRVLLGSVVEAVVRRASLPVLLVRAAAMRGARRRTSARARRAR